MQKGGSSGARVPRVLLYRFPFSAKRWYPPKKRSQPEKVPKSCGGVPSPRKPGPPAIGALSHPFGEGRAPLKSTKPSKVGSLISQLSNLEDVEKAVPSR